MNRLLLAGLLAACAALFLACGSPVSDPAAGIPTAPDTARITYDVGKRYEPELAKARARIAQDEKAITDQQDVVTAQTAQHRRAAEEAKLQELRQKLQADKESVEHLKQQQQDESAQLIREEQQGLDRQRAEAKRRRQAEQDAEAERELRAAVEARIAHERVNPATVAKFGEIRDGMSYEQVKAIMGVDGEHLSHVGVGGMTADEVAWKNEDGSNVIVTFSNSRVSGKAQFGLR